MRVIGDVHGNYKEYIKIASESPDGYSVQVGDMGFDYSPLMALDPTKHKFLGGNHDNYDTYFGCPHSLGGFGPRKLGNQEFFFVRGAQSIDMNKRTIGVDWWEGEQIAQDVFPQIWEDYGEWQGKIVLSHDCPQSVFKRIHPFLDGKSWTRAGLDGILSIRQPAIWIFGHHHIKLDVCLGHGHTRFICLPPLSYIDITE